MKNTLFVMSTMVLMIGLAPVIAKAQTSPAPMQDLAKYPWTDKELLEPEVLAASIRDGKAPLLLNIGVVEDIKGARHIGAASKTENLNKLKAEVSKLPKNTQLVIYCGCCPFTRCPNAQPAFNTLKQMGFTNIKLLNLSTNLKTNWSGKGYPLAE